jgi:hypothetical protein
MSVAVSLVTVKTFPLRNTNIPTARTKIIKKKILKRNECKYQIRFPKNHKQEFYSKVFRKKK